MSWLIDLIFGRDRKRQAPTSYDEEAEAAERWRRTNAEARAAGCLCGRPATHVRYGYGTVGGVPAEMWSCEEHTNVNGWRSTDGVHYEPIGSATFDGMERWVSAPYPATRRDIYPT